MSFFSATMPIFMRFSAEKKSKSCLKIGPDIRVDISKIILFLNQIVHCEYSKEPSQ